MSLNYLRRPIIVAICLLGTLGNLDELKSYIKIGDWNQTSSR